MIVALVLVALGNLGMKGRYVAVIGSLASLLTMPFLSHGSTTLTWFTVGTLAVSITVTMAQFNTLLLFVVLFVGTLIMIYSAGFMEIRSEQRRFYIEILSFEIAMAAFSMSGGFILTFIAWEFLSLFSYLLIGFWYSREKAARASRFAITMVLMGDIALLASIVVFWHVFGTFNFASILDFAKYQRGTDAFLGSLLLLIAVFTKSAQFPFQEWLPDAMEGPTPVSAFLHSTTMVKAGVFVAIVLFPLFAASKALNIMLIVGLVSAVLTTLNAIREKQIKRVIAYSTAQELSLMLVAVGSGAIFAAIYFFVIQSFYKALLFFSAGAVMRSTDNEDLEKVGGLRYNRVLYISTAIGILSLAGFLPLSGGFSIAGIDAGVSANLLVYAVISAISFMTSLFIFRWFTMISKPVQSFGTELRYKAESRKITYPIAVLAICTVAASALFFYMPGYLTHGTIEKYLLGSSIPTTDIFDVVLSTVLIIAGAFLGYMMYKPGAKKRIAEGSVLDFIMYNRRIMLFGYRLFTIFMYEIADGIMLLDTYINELVDWFGHVTVVLSKYARKATVGSINPYVLAFAAGMLLLALYMYVML